MSNQEMTPEHILDAIERQVASLYALVVRLADVSLTPRLERRLVRLMFIRTQTLERLARDTNARVLNPDAAVEVGAVLTRAVQRLEIALQGWRSESQRIHLATSAEHLADAASALLEKLIAAPWIGDRESSEAAAGRAPSTALHSRVH